MNRLLAFLAAMLVVWPAMAEPLVSGPSSPKSAFSVNIVFQTGDTADSRAIPVSGFCSVRYQQAGGDDASLYAVTTATAAASSGTLIGAFTASTTTATTFTAGTRWVKAVATDATAGGSVMTIDCAPLTGGGGGAVNVAYDADADGDADSIVVEGDYNRDGSVTLEDVYDAANSLTDTGPKFLGVQGVFDSSAMDADDVTFWDTTNMIELDANTTMQCAKSARLYGPSLAWWKARGDAGTGSATRLIANTAGEDAVTVRDCFVENTELLSPFDGDNGSNQDWITPLFGGIHFTGCDGCVAEGNTVRGSPHSGYFMTQGKRSAFRNNIAYATGETFNHRGAGTAATLSDSEPAGETSLNLSALPANCAVDDWILIELDATDPLSKDPSSPRSLWAAAWITSAADPVVIRRAALATGRNPGLPSAASAGNIVFCPEGDKHAFETYTEDDTVAIDNQIVGNFAELISGIPFMLRGVDLTENSCEDGSDTTCWHENTLIADNVGVDTNDALLTVRGSRGAVLRNNIGTRTGGVTFISSTDFCSASFDDTGTGSTALECSTKTVLTGNVFRDCKPNGADSSTVGGCVRINNGHEYVTWDRSNVVDGTIGGGAYAVVGETLNSDLFFRAQNTAGPGLIDGMNASTTTPFERPIKIGIDFRWIGLETPTATTSPAIVIRDLHTATITFDPVTINGLTASALFMDPISGSAQVGPNIRNFDIDSTWAGYSGTFATVVAMDAALQCSPEYEGVWALIQNAASATDCSTGGGATENRCRCDGSDFVNVDPEATRNVIQYNPAVSETITGGVISDGVFTNVLSSASAAINIFGAGTIADLTVQGVTFRKGAGMLTADTMRGFEEEAGLITGLTVRDLSFLTGVAAADRYVGLEDADFSGDAFIYDTTAPSGACTAGSLWNDTDAAANAVLNVCEAGTWSGL